MKKGSIAVCVKKGVVGVVGAVSGARRVVVGGGSSSCARVHGVFRSATRPASSLVGFQLYNNRSCVPCKSFDGSGSNISSQLQALRHSSSGVSSDFTDGPGIKRDDVEKMVLVYTCKVGHDHVMNVIGWQP
jgi:hypothetical protein